MVHHYLFDYPKYVRERHTLCVKLRQKALSITHLLTSKHAQQALFAFINATERLKATFGDILAIKYMGLCCNVYGTYRT